MGRASNKKVARAAGIGGGRTSKGRPQLGWYTGLTAIFLIGGLLLFFSISQRRDEISNADRPPAANRDHWHVAYAFYVCNTFAPVIATDRDIAGIHTHKDQAGTAGDSLIHVHPYDHTTAGKNATLDKFARSADFVLKEDELRLPGEKASHKNGQKCGDKPARLQALVDGKLFKGDVSKIRFKDRQKITVAFVPTGTKIPAPPNADMALSNISDLGPEAGGAPTGPQTAPGIPGGSGAPPPGVSLPAGGSGVPAPGAATGPG